MSDRQIPSGKYLSIIKKQREVGGRSGIANRACKGLARIACVAIALGIACATLGQVQEEWVVHWNGPGNGSDGAVEMVLDEAGNVYITGRTYLDGASNYNYATLKYDPNGILLWERIYDGGVNAWDEPSGIALDTSGNVYVTGHSLGPGTRFDYATVKYDSDGNLLWVSRYNGTGNHDDRTTAIAVDENGNVYVTGYSVGVGTDHDYATVKYDTDGNLVWVERYDGTASGRDEAHGIALDSTGNVYVTGHSYGILEGTSTRTDYVTLKYDSNGNLLWTRRYDGPNSNYDRAAAIVVDDLGNVYVTGESKGIDDDYATLKYSTTGNLVWARRYNGPGNGSDRATAIAVDNGGNVYVTGSSPPAFGEPTDYATLKYDSDGNLAWVRSYNGPGDGIDDARAVTVDGFGGVYVTGFSVGPDTNVDIATVKYDSDGNSVWEMRHNGAGNGNDAGDGVAVNNAGDVYVLGDSTVSGPGRDFTTIKYSQGTTVPPDSFSLFRGILTGGGLGDLLNSDDSYLDVQPGITLSEAERPVQLIVVGTAPTETPTELKFRVEAHADINNIGQWIDLWNYDTSSYEQVDFMIATTTDSIVEVSITTNPERFIQAGTKQMRARVSYKEAGIVLLFPWLISFDQTAWVIVP